MQTHAAAISSQNGLAAGSPLVLEKKRPVHFIGVGGVGMSAVAKILLELGYTVTGSDARENPYLAMLRARGGEVFVGHAAAQVPKNAVVVTSTAIQADNPEVQAAQEQGLPLYHRSDVLREILKLHKVSIGLTGTHGKTTLTGMTGMVLEAGGLDPTIVAGGKIPSLKTNAKTGKSAKYVVAELDESDGTVVQYTPTYSVIANLELDHPDHYQGGLEEVITTFQTFLSRLNKDNTVLFNMDCPITRSLCEQYAGKVNAIKVYTQGEPVSHDDQTYYLAQVELHLEGGYQGELYQGERHLGRLWLQVPGRHNLGNAMFAAIIGLLLGISFDEVRRVLENFVGMGRRFERLGKVNGAHIVDDYAHHPTEVAATLKAAREFNNARGRVIAMFQPHRYQRLKALWNEFLQAFDDADEVIVLDVYGAGETPIEGVSGKEFAEALSHSHPAVEYWPSADWELVVARLKTILTSDDLFITLGAGDVTQVGQMLAGKS